MPLSELNVLLPCHSLDDFPTHYTGEAAEGILAAWTALWHPALIAAVGKLPVWLRSDNPPEQLAGRLLTVPQVVQDDMPGMFFSQAEHDGARLITGLHRRDEIVAAALDELRREHEAAIEPQASRERQRPENRAPIDQSLAADFLALGFCYLQTEVLTRRMRYMSNLDEAAFERATLVAAKAAVVGSIGEARTELTAAFNTLLESRGYFYPVDAYFLDLTLVGPTTMGAALRDELAVGVPLNILLSASTLQLMAAKEPDTLTALRAGWEAGTVGLIGGELNEIELPLMPHESILAQLRLAGEIYDRLLGRRPTVFGRWRCGLTPVLPQILHECGFIGALHFTLDGTGRFPQSDRIKSAWTGLDGTSINAISKPPLDASRPETFLALSQTLGDTMDHDFVATAVFAHWPGQAEVFYGDLRRAAKYAAVLGKFATVDEYFRNTESSGTQSKFPPDQYRSPYLQQAVTSGAGDPITSPANFWRHHAQHQAAETLATMAGMLQCTPHAPREETQCSPHAPRDEYTVQILEAAWHEAANAFALGWHGQATSAASRCREPSGTWSTSGYGSRTSGPARLAGPTGDHRQCMGAEVREDLTPAAASEGYLLINPLNFPRRVGIELPQLSSLPEIAGPVIAADDAGGTKRAVVEVPPLGFAWITANPTKGEPPNPRRTKPQTIVSEGNTLRNEFCKVKIHPTTGGIQSIHDFQTRGNRLSQQLALRLPSKSPSSWQRSDEPTYTTMIAESIDVRENGQAYGSIQTTGRLVDAGGNQLARFEQVVSLWQGRRIVEIEMTIASLVAELTADPWNSYFAARFAWSDSTAELRGSVHGCSVSTTARRLESPEFIEIDDGRSRTAILTGGLAYHRRSGDRMLDTILKVRSESAVKFRLGIGINMQHVWRAAQEMLVPPTVVFQNAVSPQPVSSGWLFHIDAPNVMATHWSPLECTPHAPREEEAREATPSEETSTSNDAVFTRSVKSTLEAGRVAGFRVRLLETEARRGPVRVRCFRPPTSAQQIDLGGKPRGELAIDGDAIVVEIGPYEWVQVEARW